MSTTLPELISRLSRPGCRHSSLTEVSNCTLCMKLTPLNQLKEVKVNPFASSSSKLTPPLSNLLSIQGLNFKFLSFCDAATLLLLNSTSKLIRFDLHKKDHAGDFWIKRARDIKLLHKSKTTKRGCEIHISDQTMVRQLKRRAILDVRAQCKREIVKLQTRYYETKLLLNRWYETKGSMRDLCDRCGNWKATETLTYYCRWNCGIAFDYCVDCDRTRGMNGPTAHERYHFFHRKCIVAGRRIGWIE